MLQLPKPTTTQKVLVSLSESYELCRQITSQYSKTFYLGTLLMPPKKRRAIWAIYVWCRRTDELVDGPQAASTNSATLDLWEKNLESIFAGVVSADVDLALVDTLENYPMDIQPFRDMIAGVKMDLYRSRYETFEDLYLYCYRVAGTVGLMTSPILGLDQAEQNAAPPWEKLYPGPQKEAVALGIANQLVNILRDVGEDAQRGRIYLPLEDLRKFDYSPEDLLAGVIDERWRALMQFEIVRARNYYQESSKGIKYLTRDARWPVWASLLLYQGILDVIEQNQYDVFNRRAYVPGVNKFFYLPEAWLKAQAM